MRYRISLEGIVQGVGFRPFVKRLAGRFGLPGIVFNSAGGVTIEIEASEDIAQRFIDAIAAEAPAASRIERNQVETIAEPAGYTTFQIAPSAARDPRLTLISPDLATCPACLNEIRDPTSRRFAYPFTNCTNCGPRYTITLSTPWDRANTTMREFPLCSACASEYHDVNDRRFHAEPIACPDCGPRLSVELGRIMAALEEGQIVAVRGLGGFQLACDALNPEAVNELRRRKRRTRKPFAVMMRDVATVERYCYVDAPEREVLMSSAAPIVLLRVRDQTLPFAAHNQVGAMLPSTPLHHLLLGDARDCLVMTSGNISEEPIVIRNDEAIEKLAPVTDLVVTHDREIFTRVDDSVIRVFENKPRTLRRARGYAPAPIRLPHDVTETLAVGAELKNTFCLTKGRFAILSQHIGDMENVETLQFFEETLRNLQSVYQIRPQVIGHDLHPDTLGTRWALARPEPKVAVQHHHAHIASCMAENGLDEPVIGVAFDGTGFGSDGQIWGGEFLLCDYGGFERVAHLRNVPLPGGDRAAREGWRMAASHLADVFGPAWRDLNLPCRAAVPASTWNVIDHLIRKPRILTSSCGRLFDAVAAICGISFESTYEGESAMLLEAAAAPEGHVIYPFDPTLGSIDTRPLVRAIVRDMSSGCSPATISRCFNDTLAHMIEAVCWKTRERSGMNRVCLSGGTFQNHTLLHASVSLLRAAGFEVFLHAQVPPNDGGLSLGQALIAHRVLKSQRHPERT